MESSIFRCDEADEAALIIYNTNRHTGQSDLHVTVHCCSLTISPSDLILSAADGLSAFRSFLKTEFSDENIEFWMACEDYKKTKSSTKMASKANKIYHEFIDVQAPREVNIDYGTRERIKKSLEAPSPSSLDEVQAKVYSLMEKDSYPRFLRSKMYRDIVNRTHPYHQRRSV
ncbi:hypothetical protein NHX12_034007 [Muraenolepis orangiensis]|uniref:Regulator of G-protein signaling 8 n=1 Tax=Muraenolepis orangiensis TaxID=630683 RepID=A0A9Q0IJA8_9TELE|nr:hypothetical protein NHX12_034007 [Muraenolepis orangiensis]